MIGLYFGGQWFQTAFGNQYGNIELDAALAELYGLHQPVSFPVPTLEQLEAAIASHQVHHESTTTQGA